MSVGGACKLNAVEKGVGTGCSPTSDPWQPESLVSTDVALL